MQYQHLSLVNLRPHFTVPGSEQLKTPLNPVLMLRIEIRTHSLSFHPMSVCNAFGLPFAHLSSLLILKSHRPWSLELSDVHYPLESSSNCLSLKTHYLLMTPKFASLTKTLLELQNLIETSANSESVHPVWQRPKTLTSPDPCLSLMLHCNSSKQISSSKSSLK